jgi:hypothetical protein
VAEGLEDCVAGGCVGGEDGSVVDVGVSAEAVHVGGAAEWLGDRVLDGTVGGETVGGETVGSETAGGEKLMFPLAVTLGKALLILPLSQPAASYPAARIARATPSVLVIAGLLPYWDWDGLRSKESAWNAAHASPVAR